MAGTSRKLAELMGRDLKELDLLALSIDGIETAEHTIVAALGVDGDGHKHPLGLWEGSRLGSRAGAQADQSGHTLWPTS